METIKLYEQFGKDVHRVVNRFEVYEVENFFETDEQLFLELKYLIEDLYRLRNGLEDKLYT